LTWYAENASSLSGVFFPETYNSRHCYHEKNIKWTPVGDFSAKYLTTTPQNCQDYQKQCLRDYLLWFECICSSKIHINTNLVERVVVLKGGDLWGNN
jgi:hypothetical protein